MEVERLNEELRQQRQFNATMRKTLRDTQIQLKDAKKMMEPIEKINGRGSKYKHSDDEDSDYSGRKSQRKINKSPRKSMNSNA